MNSLSTERRKYGMKKGFKLSENLTAETLISS